MNRDNMLKYKGYYGSYQVCLESSSIHGKIEFINDLVTFEASNVDDLKREFEASVDDYLETCNEIGREPNKTLTGSFNVRVGEVLHKKLGIEAIKKQTSINQIVVNSLEAYFHIEVTQIPVRYLKPTHTLSIFENTLRYQRLEASMTPTAFMAEKSGQYPVVTYQVRDKRNDKAFSTH